ncbi:hypothetical protein Mycsm_06356 [Mycobacterium sp. JS623]|uniref:hypothetical protein n=1 Tax=Mycobacterium sp. JS623 TaxID=212767 RepID=UPI0002A55558|nr:hypothetical protein [Mycobacterium sp. JS623]AGB26508.1 hypothetical protein Mycsm_06356 [Mycobacterium sp. JS623]
MSIPKTTVPATRAVSTAFGLVMVASAAVQADGPALIAAVVAAAAVLLSSWIRPAAAIAVLCTVAVIMLADAPPLVTATAGLCAAAYLVLRHTPAVSAPTVLGAVGFTAAGLAAVSLPFQLPWVPLLAPLAVLGLYVLMTRPFWTT